MGLLATADEAVSCVLLQGIASLVKNLHNNGVAVYLVTGGFRCGLGTLPSPSPANPSPLCPCCALWTESDLGLPVCSHLLHSDSRLGR